MLAGLKNAYESIKAFSETGQTEDLKRFDVPSLVLHDEDDQIVAVKYSAKKSARRIKGGNQSDDYRFGYHGPSIPMPAPKARL